eukprot:CAMPEP_0185472854 /NCGR_PEP_ID=MMETSP1366-20130426/1086_1 /TAXON_ID=38817 /ORGANISM="Gephyrocapsa oceanica, Strain RCC1303" /LENGTH=55 /DNA_ID=CAMNT_0028079677 /DNA_START=25 /DNA_END=189 /DNA_ORIENTATION=+
MSTKRADKAADERHQRAGRTPLLAVRGAAPAEQVDHPLELLARQRNLVRTDGKQA